MALEFKYTGKKVAGTSAPLLEFNQADYDNAIKNGKRVLLMYFADWCPSCQVEKPLAIAAFNETKSDDVVGFLVNFKDTNTSDDETAMAKKFQVPYQHTKVVVSADGQSGDKSPEAWSKDRYIEEIDKLSN